jgi:membrane protein YdbS with pleckstrin-like domain
MLFARWLVLLDPTRIKCMHCGAQLTPTRKWRHRYYLITAVAMLFVIAPSLLAYFELLPYDSLLDVFFIAVGLTVILLLLLSAIFWKRFEYDIEQGQS